MVSAVFAILFGVSLLPGRKPLCLRFAERLSGGIMPEGAERYCRRLTCIWFAVLLANSAACAALAWMFGAYAGGLAACALSAAVVGGTFAIEGRVRARRFSVTFRTSGSTGTPKTIVKTFASLAKEVAFHRARLGSVLAQRPLFLSTVEPHHMYGLLWRAMLPKAAGCRVDPDVILTPEALVEKMRGAESVFLVTTPDFLERFTAYADQYDVPRNVAELTTSGSLLTAEVAAAAHRVFGRAPLEIFGSTETGGVAERRQEAGGERWSVFDPVKVSCDGKGRLVVASPFSCARRFTMGDGVELAADGRSFALLGRTDRLAKIAGQRVSLPEMEAGMKSLPEVYEAALCVLNGRHGPFLGAAVVPRKSWTGLKTLGKRACARSLRSECLGIFPKGAAPRKFRFVHALPRNAQGKVRASAVRAILESDFLEPFCENESRTTDSYSADLTFDRDAPYFNGHFPAAAVLPGVVQLGMAVRLAEAFTGMERTPKTVKKMKFSHVVLPGETVRFTLARTGDDEFQYEYRKGDVPCASGVLCF